MSLLTGCAEMKESDLFNSKEEKATDNSSASKHKMPEELLTEYKLNPEGRITSDFVSIPVLTDAPLHIFNGYLNSNQLSFVKQEIRGSVAVMINIYHPAKVGYTFEFQGFKGIAFEITEVKQEENYVKLKVLNTEEKKK